MTVLDTLGLGRRDVRAWAIYDFAQAAFQTTIIAAIFPIYFQKVAAAGMPAPLATSRFAWATTWSILIVAVITPFLGAIADYAAIKKKLLALFTVIGVVSAALLYFVTEGDWFYALVVFAIGNVGVACAWVFYESLLPHLVGPEQLDIVSAAGYGIGYIGGGTMLAIDMVLLAKPEWFGIPDRGVAVRITFVGVAVWWALFSIPLFRQVAEPPGRPESGAHAARSALATATKRLVETFRELRLYRQAFMLLIAFLFYNDGIQTIIRMATTYGTEIGIDETAMLSALLVVQFIGIPFAFAFGKFAEKVGAKRAVFVGLGVYVVIALLAYFMHNAWQFFALGVLVGMVQGGTQALSRSLFASMIPRHKSSEFFAFFGVFERYAGILGPAIFAWMAAHTGTSRNAILSVLAFFIIGAVLLIFVNVDDGRRAATASQPASPRR